MFLHLPDVLLTEFNKLDDVWMILDFKLLYVGQSWQGLLMMFQMANGSYEIVSLCGTKVDSLAVPVNECRHVMSFIDIFLIAHDLLTLFRGKDLYHIC